VSRITALVLSVGESTVQRALASVRRQTLPLQRVTVVTGVQPFHKAMRAGVDRVETEFFVQVDADMVLDRTCVATLYSHMTNDVGMTVGRLRDPLEGLVVGVKLFRTECAREFPMPSTVSPDTDFLDQIRAGGWRVPFIDSSLGSHEPVYTPLYTFAKYLLLGSRARYRRSLDMLCRRFRNLDRCPLELAFLSQVAMARGVFLTDDRDVHAPVAQDDDYDFFCGFFRSGDGCDSAVVVASQLAALPPQARFEASVHLGAAFRHDGAAAGFRQAFGRLQGVGDEAGWLARVGLVRGLYLGDADAGQIGRDFDFLTRVFGDDFE